MFGHLVALQSIILQICCTKPIVLSLPLALEAPFMVHSLNWARCFWLNVCDSSTAMDVKLHRHSCQAWEVAVCQNCCTLKPSNQHVDLAPVIGLKLPSMKLRFCWESHCASPFLYFSLLLYYNTQHDKNFCMAGNFRGVQFSQMGDHFTGLIFSQMCTFIELISQS